MKAPLPTSDPTTRRILVVDDVADNCFLLQTFLEGEAYQVETAASGEEALVMVKAEPPALILLDVMMPGMNGYEVTSRIRRDKSLPSIPILLITGCDRTSVAQGLEAGANGFIHKPVELEKLLDQVQTVLTKVTKAASSAAPVAKFPQVLFRELAIDN